MLKKQIKTDLDKALKNKDTEKLLVLRNVWALIKNKEIDIKQELSDSETLLIIKKEVKSSTEAREMFKKGGRADLADKNSKEIKILTAYLPEEISDDQLDEKIKLIISQNSQISNLGQLIGLCVRELKEIADSSRIANRVKELSK